PGITLATGSAAAAQTHGGFRRRRHAPLATLGVPAPARRSRRLRSLHGIRPTELPGDARPAVTARGQHTTSRSGPSARRLDYAPPGAGMARTVDHPARRGAGTVPRPRSPSPEW